MVYSNTIQTIKNFLYKNNSNFILFIGLLSYLYLYNLILDNKFYIVFVYFGLLFFGYFLCNKNIIYINFIIILYHYIYQYKIEGYNHSRVESNLEKRNSNNGFFKKDKTGVNNKLMNVDKVSDGIKEDNENRPKQFGKTGND